MASAKKKEKSFISYHNFFNPSAEKHSDIFMFNQNPNFIS